MPYQALLIVAGRHGDAPDHLRQLALAIFADMKNGYLVGWSDVVARFEDERAAAAFDMKIVPDAVIVASKSVTAAHADPAYQLKRRRRIRAD